VDLTEGSPVARRRILQSLRLRREAGEQLTQTSSLIGAAGLVLSEGKPQRAAQLLGAVESALMALGAPVEGEIRFFHTQTVVKAREATGEPAFQSAWREGAKWSLEEAVRYVLEEE